MSNVNLSTPWSALKAILKLSKHLVAYMDCLFAMSPYENCPFYSRAEGIR
jgi:hypothetical protein